MKIVAPFSSLNEVEMLLHCGADELYCGVHTPEWAAAFGDLFWMNRRSPKGANFLSSTDLGRAVSRAHQAKVPVYATLNAPFYPESSHPYLLRLCRKLVETVGIDGLIVSDIPLLTALGEADLPARLHLSSLGACINTPAVDFYRDLGVSRIILPRQLRPGEIADLVRAAGDRMAFEVFALNDGCLYEEGYCQTTHALGPFCMTAWEMAPVPAFGDGRAIDPAALAAHRTELETYLWFLNNCGSSCQADGLPNGPCSLCLFGHFRDWGVTAVKVVGREASFHRKMRSLQLVKAVMDDVRRGDAPKEIARTARRIRNTPEYCDRGLMCYFREIPDETCDAEPRQAH